ncbi:MAG: O-antigen ligase family protein [Candidatus Absconditabacterales bacterium]|nr:O-antigen ligase family protein [Candidatus Absconditabacterales bacterium]
MNRIKKNLELIIKRFLGLLLLQFFLHTFVTYVLKFEGKVMSIVRMRKEILILILSIFIVRYLIKKLNREKLKELWQNFPLKKFLFIFLTINIIAFAISFFNSSISNFIISIRYSMMGFFLFILFYLISYLFFDQKAESLNIRYSKIIKYILGGALIRRGLIRLVPNLMRFFGYNPWTYEGEVGSQPPAVYYTQYKEGFVRNQFLFERPISLGFFLVVFWPLFFMSVLYKKGPKSWIFWGGLYGLILLSTFSRAAWGAWIVQTILMFLFLYGKNRKKLFLYFFIPTILLLAIVTYYGRDQIIHRQYSNTGHIKEVLLAIEKIKSSWFLGLGAASAGPASHHLPDGQAYNPENQYLQIWLEYGLIVFIGWMILYIYLHLIGFWAWRENRSSKKGSKDTKHMSLVLLAFSLGLFGLSIEGFVLHSFVDRMIVYPFITLFAIYYANYHKNNLLQK